MEEFYYIKDYRIGELPVYCSGINSGGWMIAMRRSDSVASFDREFQTYAYGFGSCMDSVVAKDTWLTDGCTSDLWLGNRNFHRQTDQYGPFQLLVRLKDKNNNEAHAVYKRFSVKTKTDWRFELYIQGYGGTAGDSLRAHHGMKFTTKNEDNDLDPSQNCADSGRGGWWYNACGDSQLNGLFGIGSGANGIIWNTWPGTGEALLEASMMIKLNKGGFSLMLCKF